MADIPDIIAAVAEANRHEKPAQVRISRRTLRSSNRTSWDDSPSGDFQPSSNEESMEHEDFKLPDDEQIPHVKELGSQDDDLISIDSSSSEALYPSRKLHLPVLISDGIPPVP